MKFIRIFLLVLIIIGIGLLVTKDYWTPPFVNWILSTENKAQVVQPVSSNLTHATTTRGGTSKPPTPQGTGTLLGSVTLSPTCPVERIPPDPKCAPKPYVTTVKVLRSGSATVLAAGGTSADGTFRFNLAPGSYVVETAGAAVYPRCSPVNTQIVEGASTTIAIICDTGIR